MRTGASRWRQGMVAVCLTGLMAGCVSTETKVVSKSEGAQGVAGQRLLVVSQLALVDETWAAAFEKAIVAELRKAGSPAQVQSRAPLALQSDKARYAAQISEYDPELVLVIEPGDGTVDNRGRSYKRNFAAGVFKHYSEKGRRELFWRGTISLEPAGPFVTADDMPALARDLVAKLIADSMLPKPRRIVIMPYPATKSTIHPPTTRGFGR